MTKTGDVKKLQEEIANLKAGLARALADYDNLQKRMVSEKEALVARANVNLITELLPLLDLINRAQGSLNDPALGLVEKSFGEILERNNLKSINEVGISFDPNIHEVVDIVPGGKKGEVAEVLAPGYRLDDWVIRPAKVRVFSDDKN